MSTNSEAVLKVQDISKRFGGIQALNHVQLEVYAGEVHALLGENGAGKSTLMNIVSGIYKPDGGTLYLHGKEVSFKSPLSAKQHGIVKVHQELQLVPEMSVAQNIFLGNEPTKGFGVLDYNAMYIQANEMLKELDAEFDSRIKASQLSTAQMQMVEIAKALKNDFSLLILDEPTASLTLRETERLFKTVRALREQGKAIIYISHRMDEVFELCDRATVFRDGKYIDTISVGEITREELVRMMVARDISVEKLNITSSARDEIVLSVKDYSDGKHFRDVSFDLHKGEILGFSGLVGAGRTEVMRAIFGADRKKSGTLYVHDKQVDIHTPKQAMKAGIMLIPEDRKLQGFVKEMINYSNVALSNLSKFTHAGFINFKEMRKTVDGITTSLNVHPADNNIKTGRLSGGNQQKVVVGKALNANPEILILDEPTRGIDVNAKNEIYHLIKKLAEDGKSIIMISSELPEILSLSDRIIVMYEGKMMGVVEGKTATEDKVMSLAMGGE